MDAHLPSVPNLMLEDPVIEGQQGQSRNMALHANTITLTPSVASSAFLLQSSATTANPVHCHNKGLTRLHQFAPNKNFKTEIFGPARRGSSLGNLATSATIAD